MAKITIHHLPLTMSAIDANVDGTQNLIYEWVEDKYSPLYESCFRYINAQGVYIDLNIDPMQWQEWFENLSGEPAKIREVEQVEVEIIPLPNDYFHYEEEE